ncbi:MAG: ATP-binding protein [Lachnospiraceae bacterium]|nr:ATP-binding protein [Lachnospiraceae bacterium]MCH4064153.1 ATP-binding protein [Lachnospiraceae bacterium]MCH4103122.1 ATP-binding protein [Lachnospiraceae bacterium]MCI1308733.1 ATP-binding protein [Lachnospiraceae bacterium]MCI1334458.1 ATP-binding protein [Lachnospiraceae bacterium]
MALGNSQYDAVMRRYDEIRERHRHEQSDRIEEISRVIPEIKQLNDEAADASLAAARARITNKSANLDQYHAEMSRITERRASLLRTHGYPADYLDMHYDCPVCHDTGLVDGKHCACFRKIAAEIVYGKYSLGKILETENFEHFSFAYYSDTIRDDSTGRTARELAERAYQAAKALVPAIGTDGSSLYIFGTAGTGKTFLTHCIAKEAIDAGNSVLYFSAGDFFNVLADSAFRHGENSGARLISDCDLLVIDDLGTEVNNSFVSSSLFRVVNERITRAKSTIISTNLSLTDLSEKYSVRVSSRITSNYKIIKLIGTDIRILKKLNGGMA